MSALAPCPQDHASAPAAGPRAVGPTKILVIAHSANEGGAEYCLDTLLGRLDRSRFDAIVVFANDGPLADSARRMGYDVRIMPLSWWLYADRNLWYFKNLLGGAPGRIRQLGRIIRDEHVDLVYTNTATVFEGAVAARRTGTPHVWHVHEVMDRRSGLRALLPLGWIKRIIRRSSATVIFESEAARGVFTSTMPLERSAVVHNAVRFAAGTQELSQAEARLQLGLPADAWIIGCVGQLIDRKDPLALLDAFAQMQACDAALLVFVGDGPLRQAVEARIDALGLQSRCRVLPFQKDVRAFFSAIDVLALPSKFESFGLVLVEAMACGKPVVACRSQGPEEIVIDGVTGLLVEPGNSAAMATALRRLHGAANECRRMGAAAKEHVARCFDSSVHASAMERLFENATRRGALKDAQLEGDHA